MSRVISVLKRIAASPIALVNYLRYRNGPPRYRTLRRLVAVQHPSTIVEIGVWRGDAARQMIKAASRKRERVRYWGFDLFEEGASDDVLHHEVSPNPLPMKEVFDRLSSLGADITLVPGQSSETLPATDLPPIEFVFIDGGHSYETVSADWNNIQPKLAPDAVVVFDDYTNVDAVRHEGFGVRRCVEQIESTWEVEFLDPVDRFPREYGTFETQLVRVAKRVT